MNGVVASSHSEWFLDEFAAQLGFTAMLPSMYQGILAPAWVLYRLVGPTLARKELHKYKDQMLFATENQMVIKPYLDLTWRALVVLSGFQS